MTDRRVAAVSPVRVRAIAIRILAGLFASVVMMGGARSVRAQDDTLLVQAVVQIDIQEGPSNVVPALAYNRTLLLPLRTFLELSEIPLTVFSYGDSAVAVLEPGNVPVCFTPNRGRVARADTAISLGPSDAVWRDDDLFVSTTVIDDAFNVATRVEWADLSAVVGQSSGLPVVRRARRERRRALLHAWRPPAPSSLELRPAEPVADGAVFTWSLTASTTEPTEDLSLDLGIGAKLLGGSVELREQLWNARGGVGSDLRASWVRAWPDRDWLRQVRLGDAQSNGRRARLLQGAVVTNAPFVRSSEFEVEQLVGRIPPGWEVELYHRSRLAGYGQADGLGTFGVPFQLRYGQNPFELVLYGPGGEVVRQKRTIRVPFSRLPRGQFEYAVAGGRCRLDPCDGLLSLDLRYGVSSRVTVQGGYDALFRDARGGLWQPYAIVSAAVLPSLSLTGEAVLNGQLGGSLALEPTPDLRLDMRHTRIAETAREYGGILSEDQRTEASLFWRPGALGGSLFFQFAGLRATGPGIRRSRAQVAATARLGAARYSMGLRRDVIGSDTIAGRDRFAVDLSADAVLSGPVPWLQSVTARGAVSVQPTGGFDAVSATLGRQIRSWVRADVGLGWFRFGGYSLDVGFSTVLPGPRIGTRNRFSSETGARGLMFANGSVIWDPDSRLLRWSDGGDLGRAGINGVLFLDENANGVRDMDEPGLAGVPVYVGGWYDITDADGKFAAWDLFPFEAVSIEVDSLALEDPRLVLPAARIRVRPTPNSFLSIDVPVIMGAEISGYVVLRGEGLPGVPVVLRELSTGREILFLTYGDGGFYKIGVLPGEYEVTLPDAVLQRLDVTVPPLHIFVPPGSAGKQVDELILQLEPRGSQ